MNTSLKAPVYEIFSSFQGEGMFLGQKQIFLRFCGCNLNCNYCDEPAAKKTKNPLSIEQIISKVKKIIKTENIKVVSLTGGEPLCHTEFLIKLIPQLKKLKLKIYLETNASLPKEFKKIHKMTDIVSADIKLSSECGKNLFAEHFKFLKMAKNKVFVKIVLTSSSKLEEMKDAVRLIKKVSKIIPLILQPATKSRTIPAPKKTIDKLLKFSQNVLTDVRVIPQMHPIWKVK